MSLYKLGAMTSQSRPLAIGAEQPATVPRTTVMLGIGATLLLFAGIWQMQRPKKGRDFGGMEDVAAKYRARGIDPRKVF